MVMHLFVGNAVGSSAAPPQITPDNAAFNYSDYCSVSVNSSRAHFVRPTVDGQGYENCNPGARVRFHTNAASFTYHVQYTNLLTRTDVYNGTIVTLANGVLVDAVARVAGAAGPLVQLVDLGSSASRDIEILMPYGTSVDFVGIDLPSGATLSAPAARPGTRYVAGGDSITHGFFASDIAHEWPHLLAAANGFQLINHGYGGRQVQAADGTTMAALSPGVATYLIGYNNFVAQTPLATFKAAYASFLANFRAGAPSAKLYCITLTWSPNTATLTPEMYRQQIRDAVTEAGDALNILVEGPSLFTNDSSRLQDGIHPNNLGSAEMAASLASVVLA